MKVLKTEKPDEEQEILQCPQCGGWNLHLIKIRVLEGRKTTTINNEGITIKSSDQDRETELAWRKRGVVIILEYACEEGCHGEIIIFFRKGFLYVEHNTLPDFKVNSNRIEFPSDVWRD